MVSRPLMPSIWTFPKPRPAREGSGAGSVRPRSPAMSPAEYWGYLGALALLAVALATARFRPEIQTGYTTSPGIGDRLHVQKLRAAEPGRGRQAEAPWQISWRGWHDILWRTYSGIGDNRLLALAAGVVFYGLLALFPALAAFVSLYGLFAKTSSIGDQLSLLAGVFPGVTLDIIHDQLVRLLSKGDARLSF